MTQWNRAFWLLFIIMGALVVVGFFTRILFIDLILGIMVIAIGLLKLGEDMSRKEVVERHDDIKDNIRHLAHRVDASNMLAHKIKEKHETRFLHLNNKGSKIEKAIEDKYDSVAKKVIQLENRLNDATKAVVEVARRHDTFARDASKGLKKLDKLKEKTDKMAIKIRTAKPDKAKPLKTRKAKK